MKDKDIWLSPQEIQALLQGSLLWKDVRSQATRSKIRTKMRSKMWEDIIFEDPALSSISQTSQTSQTSPADVRQTDETDFPSEEEKPYRRLEGRPVMWLLGGVGFLTVFSWCYYVLWA